jgi:uncharacterized membrane protein
LRRSAFRRRSSPRTIFEQGVIVVEIMFYLMVALGCLRCLSMFQEDLEKPAKEAARDELILRHKLFRLCNREAILLTLLVLLGLPLLYLYVPAKGDEHVSTFVTE